MKNKNYTKLDLVKALPSLENIAYKSATEWMWNYCTYLGTFEVNGEVFDFGVYENMEGSYSQAIVYGDEPGNYLSGDLRYGISELYSKLRELMMEYYHYKVYTKYGFDISDTKLNEELDPVRVQILGASWNNSDSTDLVIRVLDYHTSSDEKIKEDIKEIISRQTNKDLFIKIYKDEN